MDAITRQLVRFAGRLECWRDTIQRATLAGEVAIEREPGWVQIRVRWRTGSLVRAWGAGELLGAMSGPAHTWRVRRCACEYARDVIAAVLEARGV